MYSNVMVLISRKCMDRVRKGAYYTVINENENTVSNYQLLHDYKVLGFVQKRKPINRKKILIIFSLIVIAS